MKTGRADQVYYDVDLINHPSDDTNDPIKFANRQMQKGMLGKALSALRSKQREIVVLTYYGGLTHSEIANKLGQHLGTVKTRMRLVLRNLREVLGPKSNNPTLLSAWVWLDCQEISSTACG